jgi:putative DNA primase/helicase
MKPLPADYDNLIERTRQLWMQRFGRDVSHEEAREAVENITGFFAILAEWSRVEGCAVNDNKKDAGPGRCTMRAETLATALGGRKVGFAWTACCPAHEDRRPSLAITETKDGTVLVRCHAGCDQRNVIEALRALGLWGRARRYHRSPFESHDCAQPSEIEPDTIKRTQTALAIWQQSQPGVRTPVATYLRSRGLTISLPPSIRFHAGLKHPTGTIWPAMVALVTRGIDGEPVGIHRTFLARDASGKAPVEPAKMMLGACGGGAVRLGLPVEVLLVGEGIETCLSAMQATGYPAWAALSTAGVCGLELPRGVRDVIVLADGDDPGEAAAQESASRWKRQGLRVRIARPPRGMDFNDLLMHRGSLIAGYAR